MLLLVCLPLVGCSNDTSLLVRADQYGERWPYRGFDGGVLHCYPKRNPPTGRRDLQEITISLGGTEYGINGTALVRFADPHRFVRRNRFGTYDIKALDGMDDLMAKGRTLCRG